MDFQAGVWKTKKSVPYRHIQGVIYQKRIHIRVSDTTHTWATIDIVARHPNIVEVMGNAACQLPAPWEQIGVKCWFGEIILKTEEILATKT